MAMKKPTKSDLEAGRVYRCGNCDAFCGGDIEIQTNTYVMGRPQLVSTTYYCGNACAFKHSRDDMRPIYEKNIEKLKRSQTVLKEVLQRYILKGKKSKTLFQMIKMLRQWNKALTMLLGGESTLHIMRVEFFKVSEAAMELAELIAEEEDPEFNECTKELVGIGQLTQTKAQNLAMCSRRMAEDKNDSLSMWFN